MARAGQRACGIGRDRDFTHDQISAVRPRTICDDWGRVRKNRAAALGLAQRVASGNVQLNRAMRMPQIGSRMNVVAGTLPWGLRRADEQYHPGHRKKTVT